MVAYAFYILCKYCGDKTKISTGFCTCTCTCIGDVRFDLAFPIISVKTIFPTLLYENSFSCFYFLSA